MRRLIGWNKCKEKVRTLFQHPEKYQVQILEEISLVKGHNQSNNQ